MTTNYEKELNGAGEVLAKRYAREMGNFPSSLSLAGVNGHTRGFDEGCHWQRARDREVIDRLVKVVEFYKTQGVFQAYGKESKTIQDYGEEAYKALAFLKGTEWDK